jgi:8-oxo-dGTP pyrophosphatase MutT (NUDIX family)
MHRNNIIQLLHNYLPQNDSEKKFKIAMLHFINTTSQCFQRSHLSGHITASGWLLNKSGDKVLLLHHKKLNEWYQLGGHADGDSDLLAVAIKETQEESGIKNIIAIDRAIFDIDIHIIPEYKNISEHIHYDVRFLLQVNSDEKPIQNKESLQLNWFSKDFTLFPNKKPSMKRMFDKWINLSF